MLQQIVLAKIQQHVGYGTSTNSVDQIMLDDINRAIAWTKLYGSDIEENDTAYRRAVGYSFQPIISSRSFRDELESHDTFAGDR